VQNTALTVNFATNRQKWAQLIPHSLLRGVDLQQQALLCAAFFVLALGASLAVRPLGDAHSILGLGFATIGGLSSRHTVGVLVGGSTFAGIWIDGGGSPTIAANGLTTRVLYAILRRHTRSQQHTPHHP
jgi:hypothetical protein